MKVHFSVKKTVTSLNYHTNSERVSLRSKALIRKKKKKKPKGAGVSYKQSYNVLGYFLRGDSNVTQTHRS